MMRASGFGWRAACSGVGGTLPPRLSPGGGNGKGGIRPARGRLVADRNLPQV